MKVKTVIIIGTICLITGVIVGVGSTIYYYQKPTSIEHGEVFVKKIEGEKTKISKVRTKGDKVNILIESKGKGKSEIVLRKEIIPEVYNWNNFVSAIGIQIGGDYDLISKMFNFEVTPMYFHRWKKVQFGIGPSLSFTSKKEFKSFGVKAMAIYWFNPY